MTQRNLSTKQRTDLWLPRGRELRAEMEWESVLGAELADLDTHLFLNDKEKRALRRIFEAQKNNIIRYKNELNELTDAYRREKQEYQVERPENDLFA